MAMRYYKLVIDGYLIAIGTGAGGKEITEEEYNQILNIIQSSPKAEEGFIYKLTENIEWELCELPPTEVL